MQHNSSEIDQRSVVTHAASFVSGVVIGAGLMYLFDPTGGGRRRALIRDKATRLTRQTGEAVQRTAHYARDRARGMVANTRSAFKREQVDDQKLHERVRAAMGRVVSHPSSIHVDVRDGVVTLTGPILEHEVDELIETVAGVRGVCDVVHRLDEHEQAGNVPGLQGAGPRFTTEQ